MAQPASYVISTLARGAIVPVNGLALTTPVGEPQGIAIDSSGNIFFTNSFSVYKIDGAGMLTRVAGTGAPGDSGDGGQAINARFKGLTAIALDRDGDIFVVDSFAGRVRRISPDGTVSTIAGNGTLRISGDGGPSSGAQIGAWGLTVDSSGAIYVADPWDYVIRKLTPAKAP
jgi:sugar lactone lactonase YvrE